MSKVIRAIDAKSFIIGVLSAVVVAMAMGAALNDNKINIVHAPLNSLDPQSIPGGDAVGYAESLTGTPFAISDGKVYYYR